MAVDYLDLETRREAPMAVTPAEQAQPAPVEAPARPARVVDLSDGAPSYWVRRRRQQEAAR
jgi:hypothetical protein